MELSISTSKTSKIMKKQYIIPTSTEKKMQIAALICTSVDTKGEYEGGLVVGSKEREDENEGSLW